MDGEIRIRGGGRQGREERRMTEYGKTGQVDEGRSG